MSIGPASPPRARGPSLIATSSSSRLDAWLRAVVETPGLTALELADARVQLLEDSLRGLEICRRYAGTIVDVGSGNGAPGIPLALALPDRDVVLLDAARRRCEFLELWAPANARVVWGRAEEQAREWAGVALAKALAPAPLAAEWCLPLVALGGALIVWASPSLDRDRLARAAGQLGGELVASPAGFAVLEKAQPTPPGFPRRAALARRRPLA